VAAGLGGGSEGVFDSFQHRSVFATNCLWCFHLPQHRFNRFGLEGGERCGGGGLGGSRCSCSGGSDECSDEALGINRSEAEAEGKELVCAEGGGSERDTSQSR
jgi:hypothetical protein